MRRNELSESHFAQATETDILQLLLQLLIINAGPKRVPRARRDLAADCARIIQERFRQRLSGTSIGKELGVSRHRVHTEFWKAFNLSIAGYQHLLRVDEALNTQMDGKVDMIALDVGYRSKKDFYKHFRMVTALTPTSFRRLPAEDSTSLRRAIRARLRQIAATVQARTAIPPQPSVPPTRTSPTPPEAQHRRSPAR